MIALLLFANAYDIKITHPYLAFMGACIVLVWSSNREEKAEWKRMEKFIAGTVAPTIDRITKWDGYLLGSGGPDDEIVRRANAEREWETEREAEEAARKKGDC
jgi:hypothetical protein